MLLADIRKVFAVRPIDRIDAKGLIMALCEDEDRPWHDYHEQGFGITNRQLAAILRLFDIRPGTVRIGGKTPKGYMRGWFEDAFARYPRSAATSATM